MRLKKPLSSCLLCVLLASIIGCTSNSNQMIDQEYLQRELKIGQVLPLSILVKSSSGLVCALYPYQPYVAEGTPESSRINAHLKAEGYTPTESHWAIVVVESAAVHLSKFKRSEKLDILAIHEIQSEHKAQLPGAFEPAPCAYLQKAAVIKLESQGRSFLVMGKME